VTDQTVPHKGKVLILGAGMAGIKAAEVLHSHDMRDFIILEGNNRIGGRLHSAKLRSGHSVNAGAQTVDEGGNWVEGLKGRGNNSENPVWTLAKKCNLTTKTSNWNDNVYFIEAMGKYLNGSCPVVQNTWENITAAEKIVRRKLKRGEYPANVSLREALSDAGWHPKTDLDNCIEYYEFDFDFAVSPEKVSARGSQTYTMYYRDKEKMVVDQRGYNYVIDYLAGTFLSVNETGQINDTRLHLNTVVTDISYTGDGVRVTSAGGKVFFGDYIICTFSIGVLQKGNLTFSPPLPQQKLIAINKFQLAIYTNIYLKFNRKFWTFDNQNILFVSEKRGYFTVHINYAAFFPDDPDWYVLLITAEADLSKQVENQTENETVNQLMAILKEMYGPDVPYPVDVLIPVWYNNPLFYGSYSYRPVNFTDKEYGDMKSSVNGRLYFAGEAMYEKDCGYVQSAYFTGEATALCIIGVETDNEELKQRCPGK
jgi:polyamine oxidase